MELRCDHKLHGHIDGDVLEVGCQSRFCGKRPGVVVVHLFSVSTGKLIETRRFKDPVKEPQSGKAEIDKADIGAAPEMGTESKAQRDALAKEGTYGSRNCVSIRYS